MTRMPTLLMCLAFFALGVLVMSLTSITDIATFLRTHLWWIAGVAMAFATSVGLILWLAYRLMLRRMRQLTGAQATADEDELAQSAVSLVTGWEALDPARKLELAASAGAWFLRRQAMQFYFNVTVTLVGGLVGGATLVLLYEQNEKIEAQNNLADAQNAKIDIQNNLAKSQNQLVLEQNEKITLQTDATIVQSLLLESSRRATLAPEMTALFADLRAAANPDKSNCEGDAKIDCWEALVDADKLFHLPQNLSARVSSFAQRSTPYRLVETTSPDLDFDTPLREQLEFPLLSPERGQLLETLARGKISIQDYNFESAQLSSAQLPNKANLQWANLHSADLQWAMLNGVNLEFAVLTKANLLGASLDKANLQRSRLSRANLEDANLEGAYLQRSSLRQANLQYARLSKANLQKVDLRDANLQEAQLDNTNLQEARLDNSDLQGARLDAANLQKTQLNGTRFREAGLSATRFEGAKNISRAVFLTAWAWADQPPTGLPPEVSITLCVFNSENDSRSQKPNPCIPPTAPDN